MGEQKRKPGRPRKELGLQPPMLRQVGHGGELHGLRTPAGGHDDVAVPSGQPKAPPPPPPQRISPASIFPHAGRGGPVVAPAGVPDAPGLSAEELDFTAILRRVMSEKTSLKIETDLGEVEVRMTNLEAFIRGLVSRAIRFGDKQVSDLLAAYIAGKPGRAADPRTEDKTVEEALDRAGVAALNQLVPQETKQNA